MQPQTPGAVRPPQAIRSYVVRAGRITPAQQRALSELWPRYGVAFTPGPLDLDRLFGRSAPRTLEIGFGNGDNLLARALRDPGRDFLGVEVHRPGIGHLLLGAAGAALTNLRVIAHDAVQVLQLQLTDASLDEVQLLFPDPWPKKRHHKRRLVQPAVIELLAARLRAGGRLHVVTDWQPYAEQMLVDLSACAALERLALDRPAGDAAATPGGRTATRFEKRGERLGHRIHEYVFLRRA
ncbi:MAG TPA: tRNA (guanosine(46)-N7)-methyltransferase TrmB [Steroidobacteraceae bacterium]|nr:tRNA (guanosine(46)-N7)-methyltransferase TrmB [Steroidobacteraceae bacterium]